MKHLTFAGAALLLTFLSGCASVRSVGYGDGWVKTSNVSYRFVGPPILEDVHGKSYAVTVSGTGDATRVAVSAFDRSGMRSVGGPRADVLVRISLNKVRQDKPGAMQLGGKWYPAFGVSVPYEVTITAGNGSSLANRDGTYSNILTFRKLPGFASREEAVGAMDTVRKLAKKGIEQEATKGALAEAGKSASKLAEGLFQERNIALDVPVVRSAAGLDLESGYLLLTEAEGPDGIQAALTRYESLGTQQVKEDGSPNKTANYGVACGVAACKLMLRDLSGAWDACKLASTFEPSGEEVDTIRSVIYQQEKITGVRVIPDEARSQIDAATGMSEALQGLLRGADR